jgi:hypothetical protein
MWWELRNVVHIGNESGALGDGDILHSGGAWTSVQTPPSREAMSYRIPITTGPESLIYCSRHVIVAVNHERRPVKNVVWAASGAPSACLRRFSPIPSIPYPSSFLLHCFLPTYDTRVSCKNLNHQAFSAYTRGVDR